MSHLQKSLQTNLIRRCEFTSLHMKPGQCLIKRRSFPLQPRPAAITKLRRTSYDFGTAAGEGTLVPRRVRHCDCAICCSVTEPPSTTHPSQQHCSWRTFQEWALRDLHEGLAVANEETNDLICLCKVSCRYQLDIR